MLHDERHKRLFTHLLRAVAAGEPIIRSTGKAAN